MEKIKNGRQRNITKNIDESRPNEEEVSELLADSRRGHLL